jgi:hypothetical protein
MDMTPKEKARYLVDKMEKDFQYFASREIAIKHALIAVEQIQNLCWGNNQVGINYWNEVKQEIEKL